MKPRTLLITICVDLMGSMNETAEEQVEIIQDKMRELFGACDLKFHRAMCPAEGVGNSGIRTGTDILVYDYGGMLFGCSDLLASNARSLIRWAEDHPNSVVLVISNMTWRGQIKCELDDMGLDLPNVIEFSSYDQNLLPPQFQGLEKVEKSESRRSLRPPTSVLQSPKFFQPTKKFIKWLTDRVGSGIVVDAGCGQGHVVAMLHEHGVKALGIDINAEVSPDTSKPFPMDATTFRYPRNCTVIICRPCHSDWVARTIDQASKSAKEILYIGLNKNLDTDLEAHEGLFKHIGVNAGKDKEGVWSWKVSNS